MSPYDYPDYDSGDDWIFSKIILAIIVAILVIFFIVLISSHEEHKIYEETLSFEERVQEEYLDCVSKASVNRDSELLISCKDILEVIQ